MATKDSRLAQIYRQELAKNKGLLGAFASAGGARIKEAVDLRQYLLPQSGISGAIAQRMFGKSYRYSSGQPGVRTAGSGSTIADRVVSEKISRIDVNTKLTAKNTIVLPAMARDMNLMRMNMQKMVKISGGTPSTKADMFFKRAGDRESSYESQFRKQSVLSKPNETLKPVGEEKDGFLGGLLKSLLSPSTLKFLLGAGIGGSIWNSLDENTKSSIGSFFKDLMIGFFNGLKSAFDTMTSFLSDPNVIKSIQELTLSILNSIGAALKSVFSTEVETPMGKMSLGTIVAGLATGLAALSPVVAGLTGALGIAAAAIAGWKIGSVLNEVINTIKNANWSDLPNYRERDGVDAALTNPQFVAKNNKAAQNQILKDEQSIEAIRQEISDLEAGKKIGYDVPHRKKILEGRIEKLKGNIEKSKSKILEPSKVVTDATTQDWRAAERGSYSSSPEKVNTTGAARQQVEAFLGKAVSDNEYSALLKAVSAEASSNGMERAAVATVILNRAKQHGGSIIDALNAPKQFHAITGPDGKSGTVDNPWSPNARRIATGVENSITENLSKVDNSLTEFRSMNAAAWKDVGGENRMKEHLADLQSRGGKQIGQQLFASGGYAAAPSVIAATPRNIVSPSSPDKEDSMIGEVSTMLAGVFKAIGETNNSIQSLAVASASSKQQQSASIASPYDKELYELLLGYHSDVATPLSS